MFHTSFAIFSLQCNLIRICSIVWTKYYSVLITKKGLTGAVNDKKTNKQKKHANVSFLESLMQ